MSRDALDPSPERVARATMTAFERWLATSRGLRFGGYHGALALVGDELEAFWASIVEYFEVRFDRRPTRSSASEAMPGAKWFPGATRAMPSTSSAARMTARSRSSTPPSCGRWQLDVGRAARGGADPAGPARLGVGTGDRVVAYMPNIPETVAAFLACASIGAAWSSAAPEFGVRSVIDRFAQIEPKVLLAIDGYRYGGKDFDKREMVDRDRPRDRVGGKVVRFGYLDGSGWEDGFLGARRALASSRCRSTIRCGCSTARARPDCRSRSSTARAGSCSSS